MTAAGGLELAQVITSADGTQKLIFRVQVRQLCSSKGVLTDLCLLCACAISCGHSLQTYTTYGHRHIACTVQDSQLASLLHLCVTVWKMFCHLAAPGSPVLCARMLVHKEAP